MGRRDEVEWTRADRQYALRRFHPLLIPYYLFVLFLHLTPPSLHHRPYTVTLPRHLTWGLDYSLYDPTKSPPETGTKDGIAVCRLALYTESPRGVAGGEGGGGGGEGKRKRKEVSSMHLSTLHGVAPHSYKCT